MSIPDTTNLTPLVAKLLEGVYLPPTDRAEVLHIAQGFACKDSATAEDRSVETIRARRKRIYKRLGVSGAGELISTLLALSLQMLATVERIEPPSVATSEPEERVTTTGMQVAAAG